MTERSGRRELPARKPLRLAILALDGCMLSSIAGPIDALRVAQKLAEIRQPLAPPLFEPRVVSLRGATRVRTSSGLDIDGVVAPGAAIDVVLVPGVMHSSPDELAARSADRLSSSRFIRRASGQARANSASIGAIECASA